MRALLRTPIGTVAACMVTAAALTVILAIAAGFGGSLFRAAAVGLAAGLAFWGILFALLILSYFSGILGSGQPKETVHGDQ